MFIFCPILVDGGKSGSVSDLLASCFGAAHFGTTRLAHDYYNVCQSYPELKLADFQRGGWQHYCRISLVPLEKQSNGRL